MALRLGLAMTGIQCGIGALNDVLDADRDIERPTKPIAAGAVGRGTATIVAGAGFAIGLLLSVPSGLATVLIASIGAAIGVLYDAVLKGTPWAPLGFAIGIPLLPVYAWVGTGSGLPPEAVVLLPAASLAGLGLALSNALVDVDGDRSAGVRTAPTELGPGPAWGLAVALLGVVGVLAIASLVIWGRLGPWFAGVALGLGLISLGLGLSRDAISGRRERGWQAQAIGVGVLAVGWLGSLA